MMQSPYITGLPRRMGRALSAMFARDGFEKHRRKWEIVHEVQSEPGPLPLDADEAAIYQAADAAARECYSYCQRYKLDALVLDAIGAFCDRMEVAQPVGAEPREKIARATDKAWWLRSIRKAHARRFEHTAIKLGFVGAKTGLYISDESAMRQRERNRQNARLLDSREMKNEFGQTYTVAQLADLGMANKTLRRGELMTRIRGFEEIAQDLGHVGMFWTVTCPSKYHAVGGENERYGGFSPKEAQEYLVHMWALIRSALDKLGIQPYGFRIAEPHTDGCPHWHLLLFVAPEHQAAMEKTVRAYALAEDGDEPGAQENRVKLVKIEPGRGTAAGYIAKYIAKNIDGAHVGDYRTRDGETVRAEDMFDKGEISLAERVTYWAQIWGIRQFQQLGGAPVGVWRELRRIKEETVRHAPETIKAAWRAVQKIEGSDEIAKQASWADYLRAQGGATVGRNAAVQLATRLTVIEGRYGSYEDRRPCGVFAAGDGRAVYESVRYQWTAVDGAGVVAVPWTGVNNCTQIDHEAVGLRMWLATRALSDEVKNKNFRPPMWVDWPEIRRTAKEIEKKTEKFAARRGGHG
ncbi:MAG TPA: replication endonuclease [Noviherbaspirillum sp.]|nr:replication endonuclease [Noviherbaspirillum sp.]